jgi:hypothetical protein
MEGLSLQDILFLIGPQSGQLGWTILLYIIFFFGLITMLVMPDKNLVPTLLIGAVLLAAVIAKLSISARPPILEKKEFGMLILNVIMFTFPLLSAGLIRARKKGKVIPPAIITAVFGGVYFFLFWFIEQRG